MPRSEKEIAEALAQSEAWMDAVTPDEVPDDAINDRKDLRQIGMALISIEAAEQALVSAVANARANKRSWTDIANVLGVSRQAARQRFDGRIADTDADVSVRLLGRSSESGQSSAVLAIDLKHAKLVRGFWLETPLPDDESAELADLAEAAQEEP